MCLNKGIPGITSFYQAERRHFQGAVRDVWRIFQGKRPESFQSLIEEK